MKPGAKRKDEVEIMGRIKQARKDAGLTKQELADQIGVGERTIANYESVRVPYGSLKKIAKATGTTSEWLLHGPTQLDRMEEKLDDVVARLASRSSDADLLAAIRVELGKFATRITDSLQPIAPKTEKEASKSRTRKAK